MIRGQLFLSDAEGQLPLYIILAGAAKTGSQFISANGRVLFDAVPQDAHIFVPERPADARFSNGQAWPWWDGVEPEHDAETRLMADVRELIAGGNIDTKRIYIIGFSRGAEGAWRLRNKYPSTFAAAACFAPSINQTTIYYEKPGTQGDYRLLLGGTPDEQPGRYAERGVDGHAYGGGVYVVSGLSDQTARPEHVAQYMAVPLPTVSSMHEFSDGSVVHFVAGLGHSISQSHVAPMFAWLSVQQLADTIPPVIGQPGPPAQVKRRIGLLRQQTKNETVPHVFDGVIMTVLHQVPAGAFVPMEGVPIQTGFLAQWMSPLIQRWPHARHCIHPKMYSTQDNQEIPAPPWMSPVAGIPTAPYHPLSRRYLDLYRSIVMAIKGAGGSVAGGPFRLGTTNMSWGKEQRDALFAAPEEVNFSAWISAAEYYEDLEYVVMPPWWAGSPYLITNWSAVIPKRTIISGVDAREDVNETRFSSMPVAIRSEIFGVQDDFALGDGQGGNQDMHAWLDQAKKWFPGARLFLHARGLRNAERDSSVTNRLLGW